MLSESAEFDEKADEKHAMANNKALEDANKTLADQLAEGFEEIAREQAEAHAETARRLAILLLCCIPRCYAQTTTTITGTIKDLTGAVVTSGKVTFDLPSAIQTIIGANASFTPSTVICNIQSNGTLQNVTNSGACVVTMNTALAPPGTSYKVTSIPITVPGAHRVLRVPSVPGHHYFHSAQTSPCYNCGSYLQLLGLPKIWTQTNQFNSAVYFKSGTPWYDVTAFGAKGDCSTDDTTAIQAAYSQAASDLVAGLGFGGGGTVYFPKAACNFIVSTLNIPGSSHGWIVSLMDNGLIANTINIGSYNAFLGRSGNNQGSEGSFTYAPYTTWGNRTSQSAPLLNIQGVTETYFQNISFVGNTSSETVHIHDNSGAGSTDLSFDKCMFSNMSTGYDMVADSSGSSVVSGFSLFIDKGSFQGANTASFTNFAFIEIKRSFLGSGQITITNTGIPSDGDLVLDNVISEGLTNRDLVKATGTYVNDFTFRDVKMADTAGTVYMFTNLTSGAPFGPVHFDMNPTGNIGTGLMDPTATFGNLSYGLVNCEGAGCPAWTFGGKALRSLYPVAYRLCIYVHANSGD